MVKTIGVLGSGIVGVTLANGLKTLGYKITLANRSGHSVAGWKGKIGSFDEVAASSELIILAVKGSAALGVVQSIKHLLDNKTVIDTTNPIADKPPDEGVLNFFTNLNESLMEQLQKEAPKAHFVKAFNSVGNALMINPNFSGQKPVMIICGNDEGAKKVTGQLLKSIGWDYEDFGSVKSARAIEPLCILWCIPGFINNSWSHAFTLLKN